MDCVRKFDYTVGFSYPVDKLHQDGLLLSDFVFRDEWMDFIRTFDYIRDLAVEEPGDSPIISARLDPCFIHPDPTLLIE